MVGKDETIGKSYLKIPLSETEALQGIVSLYKDRFLLNQDGVIPGLSVIGKITVLCRSCLRNTARS